MPMYNLFEYSDNYSMTSESFWSDYRDEIMMIQMEIMLLIIRQVTAKQ